MNKKTKKVSKLLSLMLALTMIVTVVLPTSIFAVDSAKITTTLGESSIIVDTETEFTVTINPGSVSAKVLGNFEIKAEQGDIASLEYLDSSLNTWKTLPMTFDGNKLVGTFGIETTGGTTTGGTTTGGSTTGGSTTGGTTTGGSTTGGSTTGGTTTGGSTTGGSETGDIETGAIATFRSVRMATVRSTDIPMMGETSVYKIKFANAGDYSAKIYAYNADNNEVLCEEELSLSVIGYADYSSLDSVVSLAETYNSDEYTAYSFTALETAIGDAKAVDRNLLETEQSVIDTLEDAVLDAIDALVKIKTVTFTAAAVADDASVDYAKANKIVLVFAEPIADSANELISKLNISDKVSDAIWTTKTVYTITLKENHGLKNDTEVAFDGDETIFTVSGDAMADAKAIVVGNLEEAYEEVTATAMTATIVNVDDKPYMVDGDEIVLVFNAPVYGNPSTITVNGMTFAVVDDTNNTVYKKVLGSDADAVTAGMTLTFDDGTGRPAITTALKGTFGGTVVPVVVRALVEDADGTAKTAGDKINVFFNAPTNKVAGAEETNFTGALAGANGVWVDNQTLVITLGETPITINDKIDLSNLGIKDFYGTEAVSADEIVLEGSFGTAVQPALLTLTAISKQGKGAPSAGDEIYLAFNVKMREDSLNLQRDFDFNYGDYGTGSSVAWATGDEYAEYSTIIITLGEGASVVPGTTKITIEKELFEESGIKSCEVSNLENRIVTGTFGTSIAPSLISASVVKRSTEVGSQPGDQIVLLFNVPTNAADIINLISVAGGDLGNNIEEGVWSNNNTIYTITLGDGTSIDNNSSITFTNTNGVLKDINNQKVAATKTLDLNGSFGEEADKVGISPSSVTATIVKTTAVAGAQAGDQIVFAFNVATNGVDLKNYFAAKGIFGSTGLDGGWSNGNTIYTLVLGEGATVTDTNVVEFTVEAGIKDKNEINGAVTLTAGSFIGSFGATITPSGVAPEVMSATIVKKAAGSGAVAGDMIVIAFNMATNKADLFEHFGGEELFGKKSEGADGAWNKTGNVFTITLGKDSKVTESTVLKIQKNAGLKDVNEYSDAVEDGDITLTGSFGEAINMYVLGAVAYSALVNGNYADFIDIEFNVDIEENPKKTIFGANTEKLFGTNYDLSRNENAKNILTVALGTDYAIEKDDTIEFSDQKEHLLASADGKKLAESSKVVVTGELRKPMVKEIIAVNEGEFGKIQIVFSSKTNAEAVNLSSQSASLGTNATGTWINNYTLEITLGANRTISVGGGYIVLNGLGITNGFDDNEVVGQYFISKGELPEDELKAVDARVNQRGDISYLTVIFNKPTNMDDTMANITLNDDSEESSAALFGTGATMTWETATKLVITLGADSKLKNEKELSAGATIAFANLKFANGLGSVDTEAKPIKGSFDGRETALDKLTAKVEGDYTIATVTLTKQDLDFGKNVEPEGDEEVDNFDAIVTFVIWDKDGKLVTDMNSMNIDVNAVDKIELQSKFATKEAAKVDVYVTDTYIDAITEGTPAFDLLADTVTSTVTPAPAGTPEGSEN